MPINHVKIDMIVIIEWITFITGYPFNELSNRQIIFIVSVKIPVGGI